MSTNLLIEGKIFGASRELFSDWSLELPDYLVGASGRLTLRRLLDFIVRQEVDAFGRRASDMSRIQMLTRTQIEHGVVRGKIDPGGRERSDIVDVEDAIAAAFQAFEDGLFYVFLDDRQIESLADEVTLKPQTHMLFLRLVALAGG